MKIKVRVTPNAKVPMVTKNEDGSYHVKVNAQALDGKANKRLVEILAEHFDTKKSQIKIISGISSRNKLVEVILE